jgi:hypothetical protein
MASVDAVPDTRTLAKIVDSYLQAYGGRCGASANGLAFKVAEQNVLLGLLRCRHSHVRLPAPTLSSALNTVKAATEQTLGARGEHSMPVDMTGFVWTEAYGVLPIPRPPIEQLEWVFESGSGSGKVSGAFGSAWRALFLAAAMPSLSWRHRPQAQVELIRRMSYLATKLEGVVDQGGQPTLSISLLSRFTYVVGELLRFVSDDELRLRARGAVEAMARRQHGDGSLREGAGDDPVPTATASQFLLAATILDVQEPAGKAMEHLMRDRLDPQTLLMRHDQTRFELSPWVGLALVSQIAATAPPPVEPRRVRSVLGGLRRGR